jgi:formamidopyrimidine-DNA glycosylase
MVAMSCSLERRAIMSSTSVQATSLDAIVKALINSPVLWQGEKPCAECGGLIHSQYEATAKQYVCAGCYNELAYERGWEKP